MKSRGWIIALLLIVGVILIVSNQECICAEGADGSKPDTALDLFRRVYHSGPSVPKQDNPRSPTCTKYHVKKSCLKS